jgi:molybdate transport system substrate-binding protein
MAAALAAGLLAGALAGCGSEGPSPSTQAGSSGGVTGDLTVFAAASLTEAFRTIGRQFEAAHPGAHVTFSFGASSDLATQITQGAPADVFASAAPAPMETVTGAGEASGPRMFASNVLEIAVPPGNPAHVGSLADLARPGVKLALCAEQVPCGAAAVKLLTAVGVTAHPVTLEKDVKAALAKVQLGEVDAALVYRTDVKAAAGKVAGVEVPEAGKAVNRYPIVALAPARNAAAARAFVGYVLSADGRRVLADAGFTPP